VTALKGLKEDGLSLPSEKPSPISNADVAAATHVFAIGCTLPAHAAASAKADSWDDVPEDQGYAAQRDAIKRHVERLIDRLQKRQGESMKRFVVCALLSLTTSAALARAQDMPPAYKAVPDTLGKTGDFKDRVLKVNIPRNDLSITVANVKTPTPFGFGGWVAMTKGTGGMDVMMGDLVLTQDEVNPVMSALLENGLEQL
jgi:Domain of Unknown Function (DUF1259)